jgi:hypothetical protein
MTSGCDLAPTQRVLLGFRLCVFSLHHSLIIPNSELAKFRNDVGGIDNPFSLSESTTHNYFGTLHFGEFQSTHIRKPLKCNPSRVSDLLTRVLHYQWLRWTLAPQPLRVLIPHNTTFPRSGYPPKQRIC